MGKKGNKKNKKTSTSHHPSVSQSVNQFISLPKQMRIFPFCFTESQKKKKPKK